MRNSVAEQDDTDETIANKKSQGSQNDLSLSCWPGLKEGRNSNLYQSIQIKQSTKSCNHDRYQNIMPIQTPKNYEIVSPKSPTVLKTQPSQKQHMNITLPNVETRTRNKTSYPKTTKNVG